MSAKSREIIYTNDLNNPRYSVTPLLRSYSRKTDRSENHRFLRGMEAVSQRDVVRYPEKNINALNSIGLLFKKPELFKIGCRSSEIADVERHRPHGGGVPPLRLHWLYANFMRRLIYIYIYIYHILGQILGAFSSL